MIDLHRNPRAGFAGFGEVNTPRDIIEKKCGEAASILEGAGLELVKTTPVADDDPGKQAERAVNELSEKDFDVLIICVAGWIPSWAVFSVIENFKHKPMVLLGLTGWKENGRFVTTADQAGTTALRKPMADMGYNFKYIANRCGGDLPADEILSYCRAASASKMLKNSKIGMGGYRDMRLYGTMYDGVSLKGQIGPEIEHFELLELKQIMDALPGDEVSSAVMKMKESWEFLKEPKPVTLENSAALYLAIRKKLRRGGTALFHTATLTVLKSLWDSPRRGL